MHGNESKNESNISDLIKYIEYNNCDVVHSELYSIFDLLYKCYEAKRSHILDKTRKISEFDSENLMFGLIKQTLSIPDFSKYDVLTHFPMRKLIKDYSKLDEQERKYASHPLTHVDFLIYNKLGKQPVLALEVDGFAFHKKGTRQAERDSMKDAILRKYNLPLLRFKTTESNEAERLRNALLELQKPKQASQRSP